MSAAADEVYPPVSDWQQTAANQADSISPAMLGYNQKTNLLYQQAENHRNVKIDITKFYIIQS